MITGYLIMLIYPIGFLLTLTFFKYFGERSGMGGYNGGPYEGYDYDDWDSNEQAFTAFSLFWPVIIPMLLVMGIWKIVFKFGKWFLNK
jgi:hypothetical protein